MATYLLQGLLLGATAAIQPGAIQAFLLSLLAREGWRRALPATLAPLISDGPILVLVLVVLTRLPGWLLPGLQVVGGLFLIYLAWNAWRSFRQGAATGDPAVAIEGSIVANIFKAALMNLLNPAPYIFWATVAGPILIRGWRANPIYGLTFLISFYGAIVAGGALFVLFFAGAGKIEPRINHALRAISAVALLAFGLYQLISGMSGIGAAFV
ncbi:MAG: LysE family transporter [Anaerolineae bacterium]|nr:LysE family transporter [Promineifilum sp.]MCZ2113814.1 LysE family transporter [Anaerolineae bacterium]HNS38859.1 LysE family transporter [Promineifilum sp.]